MIKKGDRVVLKQSVSYGKNANGESKLSAEKGAFGTVISTTYPGTVFVNFDNPEYNIRKRIDGGLFVCDYQLSVLFKQRDEFDEALIRIKQGIRHNVKQAKRKLESDYYTFRFDTYTIYKKYLKNRMIFACNFGRANNA